MTQRSINAFELVEYTLDAIKESEWKEMTKNHFSFFFYLILI